MVITTGKEEGTQGGTRRKYTRGKAPLEGTDKESCLPKKRKLPGYVRGRGYSMTRGDGWEDDRGESLGIKEPRDDY